MYLNYQKPVLQWKVSMSAVYFLLKVKPKGQLDSEWIYGVIVSPKMPTKKITKISALPNKQEL